MRKLPLRAVASCTARKTYPYRTSTLRRRVVRYEMARPSQLLRVRAIGKSHGLRAPSVARRSGLCSYVVLLKQSPMKHSSASALHLRARPKRHSMPYRR